AAAVVSWFEETLVPIFDTIKDAAKTAIDWIVGAWNGIKDAALAVYNWLKDTFNAIWDTIKDAAKTALDLILAPINAIKDAFNAVVDVVKKVIDWISKIKIPDIGGALSKLNPFSVAPPPS